MTQPNERIKRNEQIRADHAAGMGWLRLSKKYGIGSSNVRRICKLPSTLRAQERGRAKWQGKNHEHFLELQQQARARRAAAFKATGLCYDCCRPLDRKGVYCSVCCSTRRAAYHTRKAAALAALSSK